MTIDANGITIFYEQQGTGRPLLLLHGNSEDHRSHAALAARLSRSYTVYALDSRSHGKSTKTETLHYTDMVDDVAAFIRTLSLDRPILVGASDGGIVALMLAYLHPECAGPIVACGPNTHPKALKWWFTSVISLAYRATHDPKLAMMLQEPDIQPNDLRQIKAPCLLLAGSRDIMPAAHVLAMCEDIPNCTVHILRGESHSSYLSKHLAEGLSFIEPFLAMH